MTNNQKAVELGQKYFPDEENIFARANIEAKKVEFACLEMSKWKDEQFKLFLQALTKLLDIKDEKGKSVCPEKVIFTFEKFLQNEF